MVTMITFLYEELETMQRLTYPKSLGNITALINQYAKLKNYELVITKNTGGQ